MGENPYFVFILHADAVFYVIFSAVLYLKVCRKSFI